MQDDLDIEGYLIVCKQILQSRFELFLSEPTRANYDLMMDASIKVLGTQQILDRNARYAIQNVANLL